MRVPLIPPFIPPSSRPLGWKVSCFRWATPKVLPVPYSYSFSLDEVTRGDLSRPARDYAAGFSTEARDEVYLALYRELVG
jgi:hypothetical protein